MKRAVDHWDEEGSDYGGMYVLRWREMLIIGMRRGSDYGGMYGLRWRELLIIGMRRGSDYGGMYGLRWSELLIIGMRRESDYGVMYGLRWREMLIIGMGRGMIMEVCMDWDEESCWSLGWAEGPWLWRLVQYDWDEESCWSLGWGGVWLWRHAWIEMKRAADHWVEEGSDYGGMYGLRWREMLIIGMGRGMIMEVCMDWDEGAADHWDEQRVRDYGG